MARVGVVFAPLTVSRDFIDYPYFANLGALSAAAVLRDAGHEITVVDALARSGARLTPTDDGDVTLGAPIEDVLEALPDGDLLLVALTPFHRPPSRDPALGAVLSAARARAPARPIVIADLYQSGQHVIDVPSAQVLAAYPEADAYLRHEAEAALSDLVRRLVRDGRPAAQREERGHEAPDLDALPFPAWDLVDVPAYFAFHQSVMNELGRPQWAFPIDGASLPLLSSRGCPFRCLHCSSNPGRAPGDPKRQRRLSPARLAQHLDQLVSLGARRVHLLDELANVNEAHFDRLLALLAERKLSFEIPNGLRADYVLPRHLSAMRGHLTTLSVSAESGVQRVIDEVVDKDLDLSAIERVARDARAAGVPLLVHFMIGLPGETRAEMNQTLDFAMRLHLDHGVEPSVQFATPLPGTRLADRVQASGATLPIVRDWGPHFQRQPSVDTADVTRAQLSEMKETFDLRRAASGGPKKIILNATYKCNNRCTFCAVGTRTQLDGNFERQKELLLKYRGEGVTLLDIDGGEPTLYDKLLPLIRFARKLGYEKVNVTTNGRMLAYEEYARKLFDAGVTSVLFSVHGPNRHLHAANVGVPEAFDQTLAGIDNAVRLAPSGVELGANVTLTLSNTTHLPEIAQLVWDHGLRWLNIQFLTPFGRATSTISPDTQAAANVAMGVIDAWQARMKLCVINLPWCFMPGYERFVMGDLLKLERHMLFVDSEEVNLFEYLREQREYREQCAGCTRRIFCGGFYKVHDVAEPTWLIEPADLVRPVAKAGRTGPARERARPAE